MGAKLDIKHITLVDNIIRGEEDEYRFGNFIDVKETEVTPKRYSVFAAFKIASVMMVQHLMEITEALDRNRNFRVPESIDIFDFYYHNSSEGFFRDAEGSDILRVENSYMPFVAKVLDSDGSEMASVVPGRFDSKGNAAREGVFELFADGEHFGEITSGRNGGTEVFTAATDAGTFEIRNIPACRRANVACSYLISKDGETKAVIGGSPNILFDTAGYCQNDVILSYDDDYLVLYAVTEIFLMTLNRSFLK
jgi:hypothetical protein